jgi:hypothetical protein
MKNPRLFLNKDEISMLLACLKEYKYEFNESLFPNTKIDKEFFNALLKLENKLEKMEKNNKRKGRTSQNHFFDKVCRFIEKSEAQNEA